MTTIESNLLTHMDEDDDKENQLQKEEFKNIGVYIWIDKIDKINVVEQSFTAEFHANFAWPGTENDFNEYVTKGKEYTCDYNPREQFAFRNATSITEEKIVGWGVIKTGSPNYYGMICTKTSYPILIYVTYQITAEFNEQFELESFPFDCQDLQIKLQLKKGVSEMCCYPGFYHYKNDKDLIGFMQGGIDLGSSNFTEYNCNGIRVESYLEIFGSGSKYGTINYRIKLSRKKK
eukprot:393106_1